MQSSRKLIGALFGVLLTSLALLPAAAPAAPITVNLRVEGSERTLFEGPIAVEAISDPPGLSTASSGGPHFCDVSHNGSNGGFTAAGPSPTAALAAAAQASGQAFDASWFESSHDFFVSQFGPDKEGGAPEFASWGYAVNYTTANVGGCQFQLAPGAEVLWAYNYFNLPHLLRLTGPSSAGAGAPVTFHVSDGQTGEPIAGAAIGALAGRACVTQVPGSGTTDAAGNVSLVLSPGGHCRAQGDRAEIGPLQRSLGLRPRRRRRHVRHRYAETGRNASRENPPAGRAAPSVARILGIASGSVFARRHAPRILRGTVTLGTGQTADGRCGSASNAASASGASPSAARGSGSSRCVRQRPASSRSGPRSRSATCCPRRCRTGATCSTSGRSAGPVARLASPRARAMFSSGSARARAVRAALLLTALAAALVPPSRPRAPRGRRPAGEGERRDGARHGRGRRERRALAATLGQLGGGERQGRRAHVRGCWRHAARCARRAASRGRPGVRDPRLRPLQRPRRAPRASCSSTRSTGRRTAARTAGSTRSTAVRAPPARATPAARRATGGCSHPARSCCGSGARPSPGGCQRNLALSAASSVSRGAALRVRVTGYDNDGRGAAMSARA